jgi:hypothetical protein
MHWQVLSVIRGGAAWANGQVVTGDKVMAINGSYVTGEVDFFCVFLLSFAVLFNCLKHKLWNCTINTSILLL